MPDEHKIGIFIEECKPNEKTDPLTNQEMYECVLPVFKMIMDKKQAGTRLGFEAGREYDTVSYKTDVHDVGIDDWNTWIFGCKQPPNDEYKKWAIEFPVFQPKYHFVRRYFFFKSSYHVPDAEEWTEKIKKKIEQKKKHRVYKNGMKAIV